MASSNDWNIKWTKIFYDIGVCISGANCCSCSMQAEAVHRLYNTGRLIPFCWVFCCCGLGRIVNRKKILMKLKIDYTYKDCLLSYYCPACAQCQEYNEVFSRYPAISL